LVPEAFRCLGPAGNLLNLVEHEHRTGPAGPLGGQARGLPLLLDPRGSAQGRLAGAGVAHVAGEVLGDLLDERGFSHLPRPGQELDVPPRLGEPACQVSRLGPAVGRVGDTHDTEYFYSTI